MGGNPPIGGPEQCLLGHLTHWEIHETGCYMSNDQGWFWPEEKLATKTTECEHGGVRVTKGVVW